MSAVLFFGIVTQKPQCCNAAMLLQQNTEFKSRAHSAAVCVPPAAPTTLQVALETALQEQEGKVQQLTYDLAGLMQEAQAAKVGRGVGRWVA